MSRHDPNEGTAHAKSRERGAAQGRKLGEGGQGGWCERRADTCGWAPAGSKATAAPTSRGENSRETMILGLGVSFSATSKSSDSVSLHPMMVTQKVPKNHPKFLTSGIWLGDRNPAGPGPGEAAAQAAQRVPFPECALSPCQPADGAALFQPCLLCASHSYFLDTNHTKFQHLETAK